jgi:hypothetical protein
MESRISLRTSEATNNHRIGSRKFAVRSDLIWGRPVRRRRQAKRETRRNFGTALPLQGEGCSVVRQATFALA